ncbi:MAG: B12-binding domain-containing radical SAM protein [Candidatus Hodarchaeota archaeon]
MPQEAIQHSDSVVIGEAEEIWPNLLRDFTSGKLKKFYQRKTFANLENSPIPRRDLLKRKCYRMFNTIETARGCPFRCSFCSVSTFFGNTYRFRPVKDVTREVETLRGKLIFFVDDNIVGIPKRAKELFKALIPYKKKWIGQASLNIARDIELLKLAAKSGCIGLFIGFESLSQESLRAVGKSFNVVKRYGEEIKKIRNHGIAIHGAFIFGLDHDEESVFERTVDFVKRNKLDSASFSTLTPFPGTPVYKKLMKENRIVTKDWSKYGSAVFTPKLMSLETLNEGCTWAWRECYSYTSIFRRLALPKRYWHIHFLLNIGYKMAIRNL